MLYDTRESIQRDTAPATLMLNGAMYYVGVDAGNLSRWFMGAAPYAGGTGNQSKTDNNGYTLYFSDRRNNRNTTSLETGEYGWEDFVNPLSATGTPNGALDGGEDVNQNNALETYGGVPNYNGVYNSVPPGGLAPLVTVRGRPRRGRAVRRRSTAPSCSATRSSS